jgi:hypothetical protein
MVNHTCISMHYTWLVVLCAIAIWCGLIIALTTDRSLERGAMLQDIADKDTVDLAETYDQIEDLAMSAGASFAWLRPVVSLLNNLYLAGQSWLSAPPVRPPIVPN